MIGEEVEGMQEARSSKDLCVPEGTMTWKTISRTAELKEKDKSTIKDPSLEQFFHQYGKLMQFLLLHSEVIFIQENILLLSSKEILIDESI